tara:strand:+ start:477 stop:842 length:366 start_codon:yes stop_codon:yes gene_type:complete
MFDLKYIFIFCIWIWILSFLYLFNFSSFSTLYLTFFSLLFSSYLNLLYKPNYNPYKYKITIFEGLLFLIVFYKYFIIDKNKLINYTNAFYSLSIFGIYLIFLKIALNRTFYEYYFIDLIKK